MDVTPAYATAAKFVFPALLSDDLAASFGFVSRSGAASSFAMHSYIAYTAGAFSDGSEGEHFGTAAIVSFYDDLHMFGLAGLAGGLSADESGAPSGWRFRYRLPRQLAPLDSTLSKSQATIRKSLGPLPIRIARQKAESLAALCRVAASAALESKGCVMENGDLLTRVVQACQAAIGTALRNPSEALGVGTVLPKRASKRFRRAASAYSRAKRATGSWPGRHRTPAAGFHTRSVVPQWT